MIIASFCCFLLVFVLIGMASAFKHKQTNEDYLLAGQSVKPWLVALSAVATYSSGYMFIGMIGYTYLHGLSSIWLAIGWIFGDFLTSLFIHKRLRVVSEDKNILTYPDALSRWHGTDFKALRVTGGLITLIFLGAYAAAQFNAGSKALHALFGWDYAAGAIIGSVIVVLYCFSGGIRASIWTDAAQGIVMFLSMGILVVAGVNASGGASAFVNALYAVSPTFMSILPHGSPLGSIAGPSLFILGWLFAGFLVIGQPHVMVRFMSMDDPGNMSKTRAYYYFWYTLLFVLTILVGLASRVLIPMTSNFDAELALPTLSLKLLPEALIGLILAGIFAATMSTADSQILSCSASLTRDVLPIKNVGYYMSKAATVLVTLIALAIALGGNESVFDLVLVASGALGCAFAPLVAIYALGQKPSEAVAMGMMLTGLVVMLAWRNMGLSDITYEVMPGMLAGLSVFLVAKLIGVGVRPAAASGGDD